VRSVTRSEATAATLASSKLVPGVAGKTVVVTDKASAKTPFAAGVLPNAGCRDHDGLPTSTITEDCPFATDSSAGPTPVSSIVPNCDCF
jgi:hypothetical protein